MLKFINDTLSPIQFGATQSATQFLDNYNLEFLTFAILSEVTNDFE